MMTLEAAIKARFCRVWTVFLLSRIMQLDTNNLNDNL